MGDYNEYIFCPHCGGITIPGICVNCGTRTSTETQREEPVMTNAVNETSGQNYRQYQPGNQQTQGYEGNQSESQTMQGYEQFQPKIQTAQGYEKYQSQSQTTQGYEKYQPQSQQTKGYEYQSQSNQLQGGGQYQSQDQSQSYGQYYGTKQNGQTTQTGVYYDSKQNMSYTCNPPKKKSHWWIWLLIIGLVLFLGIIILVIAGIAAVAMLNTSTVSTSTVPSYGIDTDYNVVTVPDTSEDGSGEYTLDVYPRELGRLDLSNFDWDTYANSAIVYSDTTDGSKDLFLNKDYQSSFGSNHDNHAMSEFTGTYYEPFVDCIDTSYDYGLERHYIDYSNVDDSMIINANIAYIQFKGDTIPNEDELNRRIMEITVNDFWGYLDGQLPYYSMESELSFVIDSFIPYNDGEKMSILLDVNIYDGDYKEEHYIYGINIDLVNGEIMDNESILEIDEDFAAMFRERNDAQNGTDVVGVINADDKEVADLLSSADTNIIFYTPYGMEIGYNYETPSHSWGWATITLSDYEDYLK